MTKKIAIIEDDEAISQMYGFKFKAEGFEVESAENGIKGLELIEKMKPDIILLDIMMPEMNGDEMLAKMRKTNWGRKIKVVVLTNLGEEEIPKSVKHLGVLDIIVKAQYTPAQVIDLVKKLLSEK
jgi:two-component system, OmpR family, response regulator AdeR